MKSAWQRWVGIVVLSLMMAAPLLSALGCLTPEQQAKLGKYEAALQADAATIVALKGEVEKYRADLAAIVEKVKAGQVPVAEGLALAEKIGANMTGALAMIERVQTSSAATSKAIADLKASGTPWWAYVLPLLPPMLAVGAAFVPGLGPIAAAAAQVSQLRASNNNLATKVAVTEEMAGSVSRTLDLVVDKAPPEVQAALAAIKEAAMLREQSADTEATKADYQRLRSDAQAGAI